MATSSSISVKEKVDLEEIEEENFEDGQPKDNYQFIYWMVMFWGIIAVLPWDIMITVTGYWHAKLSEEDDPDSNELTDAQKDYLSYLGIAVMVPSTAIIIGYIFLGHISTVHRKVILSLVGMVGSFIAIMTLALIDTSKWIDGFMLFNIVLTVILNSFRALFRATTIKHLGKFPLSYLGSLQNGVCIGGLLPVLVNLLILSLNVDMEMAGFACFLFACSLCILCLITFIFMEKSSFYQHYSSLEIESSEKKEEGSNRISLTMLKKLFFLSWIYMLTSLFLGIGTHSVHPGITALIEPAQYSASKWHEVYFEQALCFLVFNVFQYLGSLICSSLKNVDGTKRKAQLVSCTVALSRFVFIPLFMMCNVTPENRNTNVYIESEYAYLAIMIVFALSDGYLRTQILMHGPKIGRDPQEQDALASVLVAVLNTCYTIGSLIGLLTVNIL